MCDFDTDKECGATLRVAFHARGASCHISKRSRRDDHRLVHQRCGGWKAESLAARRLGLDEVLEVVARRLGRQCGLVDAARDVDQRYAPKASCAPSFRHETPASAGSPPRMTTLRLRGSPATSPVRTVGTTRRGSPWYCRVAVASAGNSSPSSRASSWPGLMTNSGMLCCCQLATVPISPGVVTVAKRHLCSSATAARISLRIGRANSRASIFCVVRSFSALTLAIASLKRCQAQLAGRLPCCSGNY